MSGERDERSVPLEGVVVDRRPASGMDLSNAGSGLAPWLIPTKPKLETELPPLPPKETSPLLPRNGEPSLQTTSYWQSFKEAYTIGRIFLTFFFLLGYVMEFFYREFNQSSGEDTNKALVGDYNASSTCNMTMLSNTTIVNNATMIPSTATIIPSNTTVVPSSSAIVKGLFPYSPEVRAALDWGVYGFSIISLAGDILCVNPINAAYSILKREASDFFPGDKDESKHSKWKTNIVNGTWPFVLLFHYAGCLTLAFAPSINIVRKILHSDACSKTEINGEILAKLAAVLVPILTVGMGYYALFTHAKVKKLHPKIIYGILDIHKLTRSSFAPNNLARALAVFDLGSVVAFTRAEGGSYIGTDTINALNLDENKLPPSFNLPVFYTATAHVGFWSNLVSSIFSRNLGVIEKFYIDPEVIEKAFGQDEIPEEYIAKATEAYSGLQVFALWAVDTAALGLYSYAMLTSGWAKTNPTLIMSLVGGYDTIFSLASVIAHRKATIDRKAVEIRLKETIDEVKNPAALSWGAQLACTIFGKWFIGVGQQIMRNYSGLAFIDEVNKDILGSNLTPEGELTFAIGSGVKIAIADFPMYAPGIDESVTNNAEIAKAEVLGYAPTFGKVGGFFRSPKEYPENTFGTRQVPKGAMHLPPGSETQMSAIEGGLVQHEEVAAVEHREERRLGLSGFGSI